MGEDDVLDVVNSGSLSFTPLRLAQASIPLSHTETSGGRCCICGSVWPCDIWVEDRDAYDAEVVESDA